MEWKSVGWIFAILSGFCAKIAFEVAAKVSNKEKVAVSYWIWQVCSFIVTFVVGWHSRYFILRITDNPDLQAGLFALVGAGGFTLFGFIHKLVTKQSFWARVLQVVTPNLPVKGKEPKSENDQSDNYDRNS